MSVVGVLADERLVRVRGLLPVLRIKGLVGRIQILNGGRDRHRPGDDHAAKRKNGQGSGTEHAHNEFPFSNEGNHVKTRDGGDAAAS